MTVICQKSDWGRLAFAIGLALTSGACSTTPTQPRAVTHIVLMWLKHPRSGSEHAQLLRAAYSVRMIPGVVRIETGSAIPVPDAPANRNFDLGLMITFRDQSSLERYEKGQRYGDAMQRYLRPLVRRYVAYNLGTR